MASQGNWNSTQAVSPQLRAKTVGKQRKRTSGRTPSAPQYGSPWAHPGASGGNSWGAWLRKQKNNWSSYWAQQAQRQRPNRGGYTAGYYRGTNAYYGAQQTNPSQDVRPDYHRAAPVSQDYANYQNPLMGVQGGYSQPAPRVDAQTHGYVKPGTRIAGTTPFVAPANHIPTNSFIGGGGSLINAGGGNVYDTQTGSIAGDWANNYLSPSGFMDMYLNGRFDMLPPPEEGGGQQGFGSYYGGRGGWGGGGGKSWQDYRRMALGNWNIK